MTPPPTDWTVTGRPQRITPATVALIAGAATNLIALATLAAILVDGPLWLVITLTLATIAFAIAARHAVRRASTSDAPNPRVSSESRG